MTMKFVSVSNSTDLFTLVSFYVRTAVRNKCHVL